MSAPLVEIEDEDALLRRVANRPNMVKQDGGVFRPTSAAFKGAKADGGLSVDVRRLLPDPTRPETAVDAFPEHGLVELRAGSVRELDLEVLHDPIAENYAHGNIFPTDGMSRAAQGRACRELALKCVWVRQPQPSAG